MNEVKDLNEKIEVGEGNPIKIKIESTKKLIFKDLPDEVFEDFKLFASKRANGDWQLAFQKMLDAAKIQVIFEALASKIERLEQDFSEHLGNMSGEKEKKKI